MSTIDKPSSVNAGAPAATATATAARTATTTKRKKRTLEDLVPSGPAPTAGGKIPAEAAPAEAGSTLRAQGKSINVAALKEKLRSGFIDGKSITQYRESRQDAFDKRKEEIKATFLEMKERMAKGEEVQKIVADNIQEIASLMPANMLKGTSFEKKGEKTEEAEVEGLIGRFSKKMFGWAKAKAAEETPVDELQLSDLLLKQIELSEGAANSLEQHVSGYDGVAEHLNAKRLEYSDSCAKAIDDLNMTFEVLAGVDKEAEDLTEQMKAFDPLSREYGELEAERSGKRAESLELTQLAELLKDWVETCRDFEASGEQFAAMIANVKSNATRVLATALKLIDKQAETASVTAWVADTLKASDMTMLVLSTAAQNEARIVEHLSMRVANAGKDMEAWLNVQHGASAQEAEAMAVANLQTEINLEAKKDKFVQDWKDGKREVMKPTSAVRGATTSNPLRAQRNSNIADYLNKAKQDLGNRHGIKFT